MNRKLARVQYLRGLAAICVVIFHVAEATSVRLPVLAAGVDVFFVVSGFIMWATTAGRDASPATFLARRLARVAPIYWLATFATALAVRTKPAFFWGHDASVRALLGSLAFAPPLRDGAPHPVVIQGWTLTYEMFFYFLFAASLPLAERNRLRVLVGGMVALAAAHLAAPPGYAAVLTSPLLLEFAAGVLLGAWWARGGRPPLWLGAALVAGGGAAFLAQLRQPFDAPRLLAWGAPAAAVVAGAVVFELSGPRRDVRWLHFLGDASYSIYLWHVLAGAAVTAAALRLGVAGAPLHIVVALGSVGVSLLVYRWVEKPLNAVLHVRRRETLSASPAMAPVSTSPAPP